MKVVTQNGDFELGATETAPTIGFTDFSRRVTDDFGVTTIVERGFSRRMSVKLGLPFDTVDAVHRRLADLRAAPALWVADDRFVWLSLYGYYKDFDIDLGTPPLSRCTLSVDGLAETGNVNDDGSDPALGQASTLQLLQPISVTDAVLVGSQVTENDAPEWAGGATYGKGARVVRAATHRIYESLQAGNAGRTPESEPAWWLDVGPTNRWAMFDQALGTATSRNGGLEVTLNVGAANAVSLIDLVGDTVRVRANGYDQTQAVRPGALTFTGLPGSGQVTINVSGAQAAVGTLLIGRMVGLGVTEAAPTAGITDFSRKEIDDFGAVTVVERGFSKRMTARALIRSDALDLVADRIAKVRARPSLWIGQSGVDAITIYGFVKDFDIEVGTSTNKLSLTVEGLTKAAPIATGAVTLVPRGPYDPATIYADGALVEDQGVTWRYINAVSASGYAPPTLPTTRNGFWQVFSSVGMTPDQQQALADVIARAAALGSDNVLSAGSEKQQAVIDWNTLYQDLESLYAKYVALGSPADLQAGLAAASAAREQLRVYLRDLSPPWNQISTDTPIVSNDWSSNWTNAYQRINDFRAQITGRKGDAGASAFTLVNVGNAGFPTPNSIRKVSGVDGQWDGKARTAQSFIGAAAISARLDQSTFIGLTSDPDANLSFDTIDYGWHLSANGRFYFFQNGTAIWDSGDSPLYGSGSLGRVVANGQKVLFYIGDELRFSAPMIDKNAALYGVFALATNGGNIVEIAFSGNGVVGADGKSAPLLRVQWSIDGVSNWHDNYFGADAYQRQSNDNGVSYGPAYRVVGEGGETGADGTSPSIVFKRSATVPAAPADNSGNPPDGWSDGPPGGTDFLWQSKATFRGAQQLTSWSPPQRISAKDGKDGVSPISISLQPASVTLNAYANGTLYGGQLPYNVGVSATIAGASTPVTGVAVIQTQGMAVEINPLRVTAVSAADAFAIIDVSAAGQTQRVQISATILREGSDGSTASRLSINTPQLTWSSFSQHGNSLGFQSSTTGKIRVNLEGAMMGDPAVDYVLRFVSKLQYRSSGSQSWIDVPSSETTSTEGGLVNFGGDNGNNYRPTRAAINSNGPYVLSGLTADSAYEFRVLDYKTTQGGSTSVGLSVFAERIQ